MKTKIGVIGGGNMGSAIISGIHKRYDVVVCEKDKTTAQMLRQKYKASLSNLKSLVNDCNVVLLAVKPQSFDSVLKEVGRFVHKDHVVISIAAGITTQYIEAKLGAGVRVIRTMPNLPAQIGEGITGICKGKLARDEDLDLACDILSYVGETVVVEQKLMDSITAVSGSGPAYVFLFVECMMKAAQSLGLRDGLDEKLVIETLKGSLSLLQSSNEDATTLKGRVTSKGGTTAAALDVFEQYKIDKIFKDALSAARKQAKKLSK